MMVILMNSHACIQYYTLIVSVTTKFAQQEEKNAKQTVKKEQKKVKKRKTK